MTTPFVPKRAVAFGLPRARQGLNPAVEPLGHLRGRIARELPIGQARVALALLCLPEDPSVIATSPRASGSISGPFTRICAGSAWGPQNSTRRSCASGDASYAPGTSS